jgi:hypothetical protein
MSESYSFYPGPSGRVYAPVYTEEAVHRPRASDRTLVTLLFLIVALLAGAVVIYPVLTLAVVLGLAACLGLGLVIRARRRR